MAADVLTSDIRHEANTALLEVDKGNLGSVGGGHHIELMGEGKSTRNVGSCKNSYVSHRNRNIYVCVLSSDKYSRGRIDVCSLRVLHALYRPSVLTVAKFHKCFLSFLQL